MQSWFKRVTRKNGLREKNQRGVENVRINISMSAAPIAILTVVLIWGIFDDSEKIGFILTIFSAVITACFEVYEWIYLKRSDSKKHDLFPNMISFVICLLFALCVLYGIVGLPDAKWNNIICSGTLLLYVYSMLLRKNIKDFFANGKC